MQFGFSRHSIARYAAQPENNYLLLRFVAALLVIYGHAYAIAPQPGGMDLIQRVFGVTYAGDVGVYTFFLISGFLVTGSYLNRANFGDYLKCRLLRLLPGLAVCLAFTVFVLGPLVSRLPAGAYFAEADTYHYFTANLSLIKTVYTLPGVFEHFPQDGAVNGSLWTLPAEFRLYLLVGLIGVTSLLARRRWYIWLALALAAVSLFTPPDMALMFNKYPLRSLFLYFLAGSVLRVYWDLVPLSGLILAAFAVADFFLRHTAAYPAALGVTLGYAVLWVAYVPNLHAFNRVGDYSYGLYIYAFPVAQVLRQYFIHIRPLELFAWGAVLTLACAALSWHLVEEPTLRWKRVDFSGQLLRLWRHRPASAHTEE
ncbi:MAG TPA: acyltransferase [Gammaproteobacteria bacterium]|nr:acyltransferase [Gammaproteobacteria bacterium]